MSKLSLVVAMVAIYYLATSVLLPLVNAVATAHAAVQTW
jgi:hypothetical protein